MFEENGKQYNGIDLLKFIMAIFVIMAHTNPFVNVKSELFINIYRLIASTAVPVFFMSSGFLIFNKIKNHDDFKRIWKYLAKTIKLYLIFTLIYLPFTIYGYVNNSAPFFMNILAFIKMLFFTGLPRFLLCFDSFSSDSFSTFSRAGIAVESRFT